MVWQPRRGFRYGAEAFWLVGFALEGLAGAPPSGRGLLAGGTPAATGRSAGGTPGATATLRAADLGTGSGIAALLLAARGFDVVGFDARPEWAPLWERTLAESAVAGRVALRQADVRDGIGGPYDLVVSNPPYFRAEAGPASPDAWKAAARTETGATLADFVRAGIEALAEGGRLCLVLPQDREQDALTAASAYDFTATRRVRVGKRRVLLQIEPGTEPAEPQAVTEEAAQRWYSVATARNKDTENAE